jgi:hypothetical protein
MFQKELYNGIPNAIVLRVLQKRLHLKAYKLFIVQGVTVTIPGKTRQVLLLVRLLKIHAFKLVKLFLKHFVCACACGAIQKEAIYIVRERESAFLIY